jgi:crossover junction endodeoxyribonuclease RusA
MEVPVMTAPAVELRLELPVPPSVNNLFLTVGRHRVKSKRYCSWLTAAGWHLQAQRQGTIGGPWQCHITLPATVRGDADNYAKPLLDLLVKHSVVDDDRHCRRLTIEKDGNTGAVLVTLRAAR